MAYIKKIKLPDVAEPYEIYDAGAVRQEEFDEVVVAISNEEIDNILAQATA